MLRFLLLLATFALAGQAHAQTPADRETPTNVEVLQRLGVQALGAVPDTVSTFRLSVPASYGYLRAGLTQHWAREGRQIYVDDAPGLPHLRVDVGEASVRFERAGGEALRTATLQLSHVLTTADGRLISEASSRTEASDTVPRDEIDTLGDPAYPETVAALPDGRFRRALEPVLLGATVGTIAYLFFAIRSTE
ncbi:MAG: hypothetical protein AAGI08_07270 [Bacteroidota bacterium]